MEIISEILHYLQTFPPKTTLSISEISKFSKTHYETVREYMLLIQLVQTHAPLISYNPKERSIEVLGYPKIFRQFSLEEQIILELFLKKRFDYDTTEYLKNLSVGLPAQKIYDEIKMSEYFQIILLEDNMDLTRIYLRNKGKMRAHGLLASINRSIGEFMDIGNSEGELMNTIYEMQMLELCKNSILDNMKQPNDNELFGDYLFRLNNLFTYRTNYNNNLFLKNVINKIFQFQFNLKKTIEPEVLENNEASPKQESNLITSSSTYA